MPKTFKSFEGLSKKFLEILYKDSLTLSTITNVMSSGCSNILSEIKAFAPFE